MIYWEYNEWHGDARWDDKQAAMIEAVREVAEQLARLNRLYAETTQHLTVTSQGLEVAGDNT